MLEVWGRRNSSNVMPVMWTAEELNIEVRRHNAGGSFGGLDTPDYLRMNPNGKVPTIRDGDLVLWESNAIVRYLAAKYGEGSLWQTDPATRARADCWMEWTKSTVGPDMSDLFFGTVRCEPADRNPAATARVAKRIGETMNILDRHLAAQPYVAGAALTIGDIALGPLMNRYLQLEIERPDLPNLKAWYGRLGERPAFRQHVMIPFGRNPTEWRALEREGVA